MWAERGGEREGVLTVMSMKLDGEDCSVKSSPETPSLDITQAALFYDRSGTTTSSVELALNHEWLF